MPAVRMTSVWPTPTMPMTITCVRMVEKLLAAVNREGLTRIPSSTPSNSTTKGTTVGIGVQEALQLRWRGVRLFLLEGRTFDAAAVKHPLEFLGRGTARGFAHRFLVRFRGPLVLRIRHGLGAPADRFFISDD